MLPIKSLSISLKRNKNIKIIISEKKLKKIAVETILFDWWFLSGRITASSYLPLVKVLKIDIIAKKEAKTPNASGE